MQVIADYANESGTAVIAITFKNELNVPIVPVSASWSLYDSHGNTVNSRSAVTISPLAETVSILLKGDDLALFGAHDNKVRYFVVSGTYDSPLESGVPFMDEFKFGINDIAQHRA